MTQFARPSRESGIESLRRRAGGGVGHREISQMPRGAARLVRTLPWVALVAIVTYVGWRQLWFLTDDAYIAFRYVSNAMAGRGLV